MNRDEFRKTAETLVPVADNLRRLFPGKSVSVEVNAIGDVTITIDSMFYRRYISISGVFEEAEDGRETDVCKDDN